MSVFALLLILAKPTLAWALLCLAFTLLATVHGLYLLQRCWPRYGVVSIVDGDVIIHAQDMELSGVVASRSAVYAGLVIIDVEQNNGQHKRVCIAAHAMEQAHFRALARTVQHCASEALTR